MTQLRIWAVALSFIIFSSYLRQFRNISGNQGFLELRDNCEAQELFGDTGTFWNIGNSSIKETVGVFHS